MQWLLEKYNGFRNNIREHLLQADHLADVEHAV